MKANSVFVLIVLSVLLVGLVQTEVKAQENLIVVPDNFPTIQGAIDAASVGDTVFVKSGTYNESVWVDKSISLVGEGSNSTVIVGDNRLNGTVVLVTADCVNVTGFTVQPSAYSRNRKGRVLPHFIHTVLPGRADQEVSHCGDLIPRDFRMLQLEIVRYASCRAGQCYDLTAH